MCMNLLLFQIVLFNNAAVQKHCVCEFISFKCVSMLARVDLGDWTYLLDPFIICIFFCLLKVGIFSSKTFASKSLFILPSLQTVK